MTTPTVANLRGRAADLTTHAMLASLRAQRDVITLAWATARKPWHREAYQRRLFRLTAAIFYCLRRQLRAV